MLKKIGFDNYKAFISGNIEIKPITILLGANSVGKSSIVQLFLMLQETALSENYKSALKLHGGFFSLGDGMNLFRMKKQSNPLKISIEYTIENSKYFNNLFEEISRELLSLTYIIEDLTRDHNSSKKHRLDLFSVSRILNNRTEQNDLFKPENIKKSISESSAQLTSKTGKSLIEKLNNSFYFKSYSTNALVSSLKSNYNEIIEIYNFLYALKNKKNHTINIEYEFEYFEGYLRIKNVEIAILGIENIKINFSKAKEHRFIEFDNINNEVLKSQTLEELKDYFSNSKTVFSFVNYESATSFNSYFNRILTNIISHIIDKAEESFYSQSVNYVSPLRAFPKRYYFLDKAKTNAFLDTLDGEAIAEILKENSDIRNDVNEWLKRFNLQVNVGPVKEYIHQILVSQNSLNLDITDVGFGVSQILPVIIQGFLSKPQSITLIEQPEIHLHPKMQADLADLFIDISIKKDKRSNDVINKYLIIETHSEYLLKRLRRRISEKKINADNVAIYSIEQSTENNCAIIKDLSISETGNFDWPKDFYSGDIADDVYTFLRNQK